jgi:hypothetical protein
VIQGDGDTITYNAFNKLMEIETVCGTTDYRYWPVDKATPEFDLSRQPVWTILLVHFGQAETTALPSRAGTQVPGLQSGDDHGRR